MLNLLRLVRAWAKARNYERVWVRNEQIYVRKNTDSEVISISSESDLNKLIWRQVDPLSTSLTSPTPSTDHHIVLHMNRNSLRCKRDVVIKYIQDVKPLIIAISETWLDLNFPTSHVQIDGYNLVRNDRGLKNKNKNRYMQAGGAACYIHRSLHLKSYLFQKFLISPRQSS